MTTTQRPFAPRRLSVAPFLTVVLVALLSVGCGLVLDTTEDPDTGPPPPPPPVDAGGGETTLGAAAARALPGTPPRGRFRLLSGKVVETGK